MLLSLEFNKKFLHVYIASSMEFSKMYLPLVIYNRIVCFFLLMSLRRCFSLASFLQEKFVLN